MGSSKNANFVTGALGGESFKTSKLYKDASSEKPDRSFAQPSPDVKKLEPKKESVSASEKAELLKDNEGEVADKDKTPFVSKSNKNKAKKNSKKAKSVVTEDEEGEEEKEDGRED
jgi:hypothetical protein